MGLWDNWTPTGRTGQTGAGRNEIRPGGRGAQRIQNRGILYAQAMSTANLSLPRSGPDRAKFLNILRDHNRRMANELQNDVADTLNDTRLRHRRAVSSERLRTSILHPENRYADAFGFGVGVLSWLDKRSPAKHYWRQIEAGSTVHIGQPIIGIWGTSPTGAMGTYYPGAKPKYGKYPLMGVGTRAHGAHGGERLMPMTRKTAYAFMRAQGMNRRAANKMTRNVITTIENPIAAQRFYHKAWEEFDPVIRGRAALIAALREAGLLPPTA